MENDERAGGFFGVPPGRLSMRMRRRVCGLASGASGAAGLLTVNLNRLLGFFVSALVCLAAPPAARGADPRVFSIRPGALANAKARVEANDPTTQPPLKTLVPAAEKALKVRPLSVTEKPQVADSGDKHDFMSQAPYFWPDPTKPDGRPYVRKDGQRNPESRDEHSDATRMGSVNGNARTLALAWYLTGREEFAEHAAELLRTWYLAPATRMNPNFNFAQAVPGVNTGRGTGMIESRSLTSAMDAAALLAGTKTWADADRGGFEKWITEFFEWAQTSKNGRDEAAARNNHGTFYDVQLVHMALFLGRMDFAKQMIEEVKTKRIAVQIKPDGSQPMELERADSFGYSRFNIEGLCNLATLAEHVGIDLWRYATPEGASLRKAIDFLLPYVDEPDRAWPYEHEKKGAARNLSAELWQAGKVFGDARYLAAARKTPSAVQSQDALWYPSK